MLADSALSTAMTEQLWTIGRWRFLGVAVEWAANLKEVSGQLNKVRGLYRHHDRGEETEEDAYGGR